MKKILLMYAVLLLTVLSHSQLWAQSRIVTGKVTAADDGTALPGVNVLVKGTNAGTTTASDGRYSISAPDNATLVFSFIGLTSQEVAVGTRSVVDVIMESDVKTLNEVVVTAMGIERDKKSLGYAVTELKTDEIVRGRTTNVVNALAGKVAGVRVQGSSGMVGAGASIFIRGFTTFTASNQPLFVVDGIPIDNGGGGNALQTGVSNSNRAIDINQDDIESMTILKGPAAAVLYGSRAASGAILITTKKGKSGKGTITFNSSYNIAEVNRFPEWQNEYAQGTGGTFNPLSNLSWGPRIEGQTVTNFLGEEEVLRAYPDNITSLFRKGYNLQNGVSFSGGNDKTNYIFSYSNLQESGVLENNELTRNTFRATVNSQVTPKINVGASAQYINTVSQRTPQGNQLANPLFRTWFLPRSINLQGFDYQDARGNQVYFDATDNPYWTIKNNLYNDKVNRIIGNVNLSYDPFSWLNVNYKLGTDVYTFIGKAYDAPGSRGQAFSSVGGVGAVYDANFTNQDINSYFNIRARRNITEDFEVTLLVGNEVTQQYSSNIGVVGNTLAVPGFNNISNALNYNPFGTETRQRLVGVYGDLTLAYRNFLTLDITGRNDWSSTFSKGKRSFFYPSVAASFVFTDAIPALRDNSILSLGKIKGNIARVGRAAPLYSTDTYFFNAGASDGFGPTINFPFNGLQGRTFGNAAGNPDIGPEFTTTYDIGTELSFLKNRISLDLTYFNTRTTDIILAVPISVASGNTSVLRNAGELKSKGWEIGINATPVKTANFSWDINLNYTSIENTVVKLAEGVPVITLGGFVTPNTRLQAGSPYGIQFGSVFNRNEAGQLIVNANGLPTLAQDNKQIGDPNPDWTGGISNNFSFKGLNLSFLVDIRKGGDIFSRNIGDLRRSGAAKETAEFPRFNEDGTPNKPYIVEGVKADGSPNDIAVTAEQYWGTLYAFGTGESYIFDASWIRLREASLSYTFPKTFFGKVPVGGLELGINGRNLLLYAPNIPHIDPEVNAQGVSNSQGLEFNALPQTRTYGAFLKLGF